MVYWLVLNYDFFIFFLLVFVYLRWKINPMNFFLLQNFKDFKTEMTRYEKIRFKKGLMVEKCWSIKYYITYQGRI